ncbi:MAG: hypothetical protein HOQ09_08045 [Gemmatimonadaceae bacterium]|nr:hypothetical protein [Gemmatimonadaceae bacterium]
MPDALATAVDWPTLAADLEATLASALALAPIPLAPGHARAMGTWKGAPTTIETRAWRGERIAYCRVARVRGHGVAIGNVLCIPDPALRAGGRPLPILGVDLVAIGERDAIVVADLSPMTEDRALGSERIAAALDADPDVARLTPIDDLPPWARDSFSTRALAVRVGAELHPVAAAAVRRVVDAFVTLVHEARVDANADDTGAVRRAHQRHLGRHRDEDGGLALLGRMFGSEWARGYVCTVLFPDLPEHS